MRTQRPSSSGGDLSKVTAQILGTGGISPGAPNQAVSSWVLGSSAWSGREAPLQGCTGPMLKGLVDPRELDVERRSQLKAFLLPFCGQATGGPQPRPPAWNPPRKQVHLSLPLALALGRDSCTPGWGFRPRPAQGCGGGQSEGDSEGAQPRCRGLGEKRERRNPSLALLSRQKPAPLWGPRGLIHSSHRDEQTWMCTHTHTHTHTRTHTQVHFLCPFDWEGPAVSHRCTGVARLLFNSSCRPVWV